MHGLEASSGSQMCFVWLASRFVNFFKKWNELPTFKDWEISHKRRIWGLSWNFRSLDQVRVTFAQSQSWLELRSVYPFR